jgi:hypothetical protein
MNPIHPRAEGQAMAERLKEEFPAMMLVKWSGDFPPGLVVY